MTRELSTPESQLLLAGLPKPWSDIDYQFTPLPSESNDNYLLQANGYSSIVLRVAKADGDILGIDRAQEQAVSRWAGQIGISPKILWACPKSGVMLSEFIAAQPVDTSEHEFIVALAQQLSFLHKQPISLGDVNVKPRSILTHINSYEKILLEQPLLSGLSSENSENEAAKYNATKIMGPKGISLKGLDSDSPVQKHAVLNNIVLNNTASKNTASNNTVTNSFVPDIVVPAIESAYSLWPKIALSSCLCHCDLSRENVLFHAGDVRFIDWEYVAVTTPILDVANVIKSFNWGAQQTEWFLQNYSGPLTLSGALAEAFDADGDLPTVQHIAISVARFLLALQSFYWALLHYGQAPILASYRKTLIEEAQLLLHHLTVSL